MHDVCGLYRLVRVSNYTWVPQNHGYCDFGTLNDGWLLFKTLQNKRQTFMFWKILRHTYLCVAEITSFPMMYSGRSHIQY